MRNRAKCKLCGDIIESFHRQDYVSCKCGEISVDGGDHTYRAIAKNWSNFLRVDDNDNEIVIVTTDNVEVDPVQEPIKLTKKDLVDMLSEMVKNIERLPQQAMLSPITHADHLSLLILLSAIFKAD